MIIKRLFTSQVLPRRAVAGQPASGRVSDKASFHAARNGRDPMTERWHRYRASGNLKHALAGGVVELGDTRFAIDRALVSGHEFFFIEGWITGPHSNAIVFEVVHRKGDCDSVAFRGHRFDVNETFKLPRSFPNDRAGFRIFGRLQRSLAQNDLVLGLRFVEEIESTADGPLRRPLCTVPVGTQGCNAGDIWRPLNETISQHYPAGGADLENAISLLNQVRAQDVGQRISLPFPANDGQAIDVLILARNRPEIAEMNATLVQQILPPNARVFVAAVNRNASQQINDLLTSLPQKQGVNVQHLLTPVTLPSSYVVGSFLQSDHAPSVAIVLDDVFIAPCLDELASAIVSRQSIVVPRANQPMLTPSIPIPRLQATNGQIVGAFNNELLASSLMPLGVAVLHEKICMNALPIQYYYGRGLAIEEIYTRNYDDILLTDKSCLDLEIEDHQSERYFFNRALLAQISSESRSL